jgi:hypothetical protein
MPAEKSRVPRAPGILPSRYLEAGSVAKAGAAKVSMMIDSEELDGGEHLLSDVC